MCVHISKGLRGRELNSLLTYIAEKPRVFGSKRSKEPISPTFKLVSRPKI